ncbi:uncharacterized protein Z520_11580 [Fonsecaea multimorphosa CBS 102226]|uniref:Uncharacterized protein n=1 Tax=Fonsecaea multimorphosa CBS 102226 TaxID=1442371 RepID=A0A0D2K8P6_9EURO|nr:uncharacterized protein Z520_11580 [Fonsecaea multimorphosa CBS 102226]KIX92728.1 hypothetical protein Z520_11580 [Fonsecaea multimorphosa CBS 102226]OAL17970.1 hypothetical protein AYO22_11126 [Fonsecaea multimorphosa]
MSTVRYFDSVPHIVRYGRHDDKKGTSWTLFYRHGVCFRISVSLEDVSGTIFSETWLALIKKTDMHDWVKRWESLCDCVITPCLPLLDTLAPSSHQWVTLDDYLHTPTYDLKLVRDEKETADVVPKITEGPVDRPSYEHNLMKFSEISLLPEDIPQYPAEDLVVLGKEKNWRRPPHKVRAPSGEVFFFRPCNKPARHVPTGEITNKSLDIINAYSRLHSRSTEISSLGAAEGVNIPRLQGIVVSHAYTEPEPEPEPEESAAPPPSDEGQAKLETNEPLCAGILLNYVSRAKTLAEWMKVFTTSDLSKYKEKWKGQIAAAIRHLHDHRITVGGRSGPNAWYLINQHSVRIANVGGDDKSERVPADIEGADKDDKGPGAGDLEGADAWLTFEGGCTVHPLMEQEGEAEEEKFKEQKAMDWAALEKVFQF